MGGGRYYYAPDDRAITAVTMTWELLNLLTLMGALGVLLERQQRRTAPRNALDSVVASQIGSAKDTLTSCDLIEASIRGAGVMLPNDSPLQPHLGELLALKVWIPALQRHGILNGVVRRLLSTAEGVKLGLELQHTNLEQQRNAVALAFGDSQHIANVRQRQRQSLGIGKSLLYLYSLSIRHSHSHVAHLLMLLFSRQRLEMHNLPCQLTLPGEAKIHALLENISISGAGLHLQTLLPFPHSAGTSGLLEFECLLQEKRVVLPVTLRKSGRKDDTVSIGLEIAPHDFATHKMIVDLVYQQIPSNRRSHTLKLLLFHIPAHLPFMLRRLSYLFMTPFTQKV